MDNVRISVILALSAAGALGQVTLDEPSHTITFGASWTLADPEYPILAENQGVSGVALPRAVLDDGMPVDPDAQAKLLSDSLEGNVTAQGSETRTLGTHSVIVVTFAYDSLARVEREMSARGSPVALPRNRTFRGYYIKGMGKLLGIIGVPTNPLPLITPYAGIEAAIPSLQFKAGAPIAAPRLRKLVQRDGRIFDLRGRSLLPTAWEGRDSRAIFPSPFLRSP